MARISTANMTKKNPTEWQQGSAAAREARANVAVQLQDLILDADLTGSSQLVGKRIRQYLEAVRSGDFTAQRAALMELATAAGSTAASLDLNHLPRQATAA